MYKFLIFTSKAEMRIMKFVCKTPKSISEITKGTKIPIASTYRILNKLEGKKYLKSDGKMRNKKYSREKKYERIEWD